MCRSVLQQSANLEVTILVAKLWILQANVEKKGGGVEGVDIEKERNMDSVPTSAGVPLEEVASLGVIVLVGKWWQNVYTEIAKKTRTLYLHVSDEWFATRHAWCATLCVYVCVYVCVNVCVRARACVCARARA